MLFFGEDRSTTRCRSTKKPPDVFESPIIGVPLPSNRRTAGDRHLPPGRGVASKNFLVLKNNSISVCRFSIEKELARRFSIKKDYNIHSSFLTLGPCWRWRSNSSVLPVFFRPSRILSIEFAVFRVAVSSNNNPRHGGDLKGIL